MFSIGLFSFFKLTVDTKDSRLLRYIKTVISMNDFRGEEQGIKVTSKKNVFKSSRKYT